MPSTVATLKLTQEEMTRELTMADRILRMPSPAQTAHAYIWQLDNPPLMISSKRLAFSAQHATSYIFYCTPPKGDSYEVKVIAPDRAPGQSQSFLITDMAKVAAMHIIRDYTERHPPISDSDIDELNSIEI